MEKLEQMRQQAADAGSMVHAMVENSIHGRDPWEGLPQADEKTTAQAQQGFDSFKDWSRLMHVNYVETETPMISEKYQYGGTPDAIATIDGKIALADWKAANSLYGDYLIQLAAYDHLWNENHPEKLSAWYILRFGKDHGDFHFHSFTRDIIEMGFTAFLHLREMYDLDKKLGKLVK
jgi:hypothetical protein